MLDFRWLRHFEGTVFNVPRFLIVRAIISSKDFLPDVLQCHSIKCVFSPILSFQGSALFFLRLYGPKYTPLEFYDPPCTSWVFLGLF